MQTGKEVAARVERMMAGTPTFGERVAMNFQKRLNALQSPEELRQAELKTILQKLHEESNTPRIDLMMPVMDTLKLGMIAFYSFDTGIHPRGKMIIDFLDKKRIAGDLIPAYLDRIIAYIQTEGLVSGDYLLDRVLLPLFDYYHNKYKEHLARKTVKGGRKRNKTRKSRRSKKERK